MNKGISFAGEFKRDAVARAVDPGYPVSEVAAEIGRLSTELARVTEEHTI